MSLETGFAWIAQHPHVSGVAVFLIALAESLAIVGLLVPGVAMMFAVGGLIGAGALPFLPICGYAVAGAIVGDGLSFWLGYHYRDRLQSVWPFTRYPAAIERGVAFFRRFGGKSILFGRFVGPVRAIVPLVAGMLSMPTHRFLFANVLSALLWAPAYLLPGMAFGASLDVAAKVTGRLVALLITLLLLLWVAGWLSRRLYLFFQPRAHGLIVLTFDLCRESPLLGRVTAPLIDPNQRDYAGLAAWAGLLWTLTLLVSALVPADVLPVSLNAWRNPWADYLMTVFGALGDDAATWYLGCAVSAWFLIQRQWVALAHWCGALAFGFVVAESSASMAKDSPLIDGHLLRSGTLFGFLAVVWAGVAHPRWRWSVYAAATLLVSIIAFSRVYLGAGELLGIALTLTLAVVWLVLLGVAYRRHQDVEDPIRGLSWVIPLTVMGLGGAQWFSYSVTDFQYQRAPQRLAQSVWVSETWSELPAYRLQAFGNSSQPLAVQWAAAIPSLESALTALGWRPAQSLSAKLALQFLNPYSKPGELPVLPHFNQEDTDLLRLIRPLPDGRWLIVRIWPSGYELDSPRVPVWLVGVAFLHEKSLLGLVRFLEETGDYQEALHLFVAELGDGERTLLHRQQGIRRTYLVLPPAGGN